MRKIIIALGILMVYYGCGKDPKPCSDPTNPDCSNYDPCIGKVKTTANFKIYDYIPETYLDGLGWTWQDTDTVRGGAIYEADMPNATDGSITYEWHIGAGVYYDKKVIIPDGIPENQNLSATLIVRNNKVNKSCFPNDDGIDTFTRNYCTYFRKWGGTDYISVYTLTDGWFRGAFDEAPYDSLDFYIHDTIKEIGLPFKGCVSKTNIFLSTCGSRGFWIAPITGNNCKNATYKYSNACTFNVDRTGKTFYLRLNPNDVLEKEHIMRGRKLN